MLKNLKISNEANKILLVTIDRPHALNALNQETLHELDRVFQEVRQNNEVSGMIVTGSGEKAFVAGADIKELTGLTEEKALEFALHGHKIFKSIEELGKPVIAFVNGFALGGGCELAMACHMRIATESAKFGQPEVNLGIIPGYGGTQRLTQLVGRGRALELMLTGDLITASQALEYGLVNHVVGNINEGFALSRKILGKIISKGPFAVSQVIKSVNAGFGFEDAGYQAEAENFARCTSTNDFREGTTAFIEKRPAIFKGD